MTNFERKCTIENRERNTHCEFHQNLIPVSVQNQGRNIVLWRPSQRRQDD